MSINNPEIRGEEGQENNSNAIINSKEFDTESKHNENFSQKLEEGREKVNSSLVLMLWEDSVKEVNTNSVLNSTLMHNHIKKIKEHAHQRVYDKSSNFKKIIEQNTSPEEYEKFESLYKEVNEHLKTIIKKGSPYIRIKSENLFSILSEGFKTAFETNTSWWTMNLDQRNKIEKTLFWYESKKTDPIYRPRYWYWYDDNPFNCAEGYGDVVCKLKPSTTKNITITWCDSLHLENMFSLPCASFCKDDDLFFVFFDFLGNSFDLLKEISADTSLHYLFPTAFQNVMQDIKYLKSVKNIENWLKTQNHNYMEFQHHGPLFVEDIESLHIPQNMQLDQTILHLCEQKGIAIIKQ